VPFEGRYVNWAGEGEIAFVTASVLGRIPVFKNARLARLAVGSLLSDHRFYKAPLFGFAVMPTHIHLLSQVPLGRDVSWLVARLKSNSGKRIARKLTTEQLALLKRQPGSSSRVLWMEGFRSLPANTDRAFVKKLGYIHRNPVRSRLVEDARLYDYSSAHLWELGVDWEKGIEITDSLIGRFCTQADLDLRRPGGG
jgi:REP element-mobilizing transposase RayT